MPPPPSRRPGAGRAVTAFTYSLMLRKKIRCDCILVALAVGGGGYLRIQAHRRCRFGSFFLAVVVFLSITQLKSVLTNGRHPKRCCAVRCFF